MDNRPFSHVQTNNTVNVDSAVAYNWRAFQGGIKEIYGDNLGVWITWNFGATFVPWSNINYAR